VSDWLGRSVEIRSAGEHSLEVGGTYEAPLDVERDADWVSWQGPGGAFHDSGRTRVSIVSVPTLRDWDRRRFRTNVIVDEAGEDDLVGRRIALGEARVDVVKQIDRCVMVTRPQAGLDRALEVLTTVNTERDTFLGVGGIVVEPGLVAVGASVTVLADRSPSSPSHAAATIPPDPATSPPSPLGDRT
jgi:hypothetical protein